MNLAAIKRAFTEENSKSINLNLLDSSLQKSYAEILESGLGRSLNPREGSSGCAWLQKEATTLWRGFHVEKQLRMAKVCCLQKLVQVAWSSQWNLP